MSEDICASILQTTRENGGEIAFVVAKASPPIWQCLMQMVADGVLIIADDSDSTKRTFKLKEHE